MRFFLFVLLLLFGGCIQSAQNETKVSESINLKPPELWIEIHDVSPGWKYWRLEQVINITEKHRSAFSKAVLFVIPNHANATPLYAYPEYVQQLKSIEARGYILGLHGYAHFTPPPFEMNVSREKAIALVNAGLKEFEKVNLSKPRYFAPPGFVASPEAADYLEAAFDYVYYSNTTKTPQGIKKYTSHEYTWYSSNASAALEGAKKDYLQTREIFRLTIHLEAGNTPESLAFLDAFLAWVERQGK